jgi:hypothetical protein
MPMRVFFETVEAEPLGIAVPRFHPKRAAAFTRGAAQFNVECETPP